MRRIGRRSDALSGPRIRLPHLTPAARQIFLQASETSREQHGYRWFGADAFAL